MRFHWLLALLLFVQATNAQETSLDNRVALIVGVSDYGDSGIPALPGVRHDMDSAAMIASAMGIPKKNVRFIKDSAATKENILQALQALGEATKDGARAFIYFSGHGTRYMDRGAGGCVEGLFAYDGKSITNKELASASQKLTKHADKVITIIDACHSEGVLSEKLQSRSSASSGFQPKYFLKADGIDSACSKPANMRTRGLLSETIRLGAIQENVVQITSSRSDEVSFDEPEKGGLATQGLRDCLLGHAKDLDLSGAVSLEEIRQCAQKIVDDKLRNAREFSPHHITITGNRYVIPAPLQRPTSPQEPAFAQPPQVAAVKPDLELAIGSLATLLDIERQRNPNRNVEVVVSKPTMKIGRDSLNLRIKSNHDGYVYLILLGSDDKSFYMLYPNGLDRENKILAGQALVIPGPDWQVKASGPAGTNHLLVIVADSPRKLDNLAISAPTASAPFAFSLNDIGGRAALINFLTGYGIDGRSESFGAQLIAVKEVP